ncbi:MAG: hypothetical protein AB1730_14910 [Myxococcota bacterium]|jgi:hypothetical protein
MRSLTLALFAVAATGCATPCAQLRVSSAAYTAGETMQGSLLNQSSFYELQHGVFCLAYLERREGDAWVRAPEPERGCILPLLITAPSATVLFSYRLDATLPEGPYRLRFEVRRGRFRLFGLGVGGTGDKKLLASDPFTVRAAR